MAEIPPNLDPMPDEPKLGKLESLLVGVFAHRMSIWLWGSVAGLVALFVLARHMVGVVGFKVVLLTTAGYLGYWISRMLERGQRPHQLMNDAAQARAGGDLERAWQLEQLAANLSMRRSWIVSACLIASALGG